MDTRGVFVNVPYDKGYEALFITLIGTLVFLGQSPRCVLEIQEVGQGRLIRIVKLIRSCRLSIHDLSRVGRPVRFNMPFELGLACGLAQSSADHEIVVFDARPFRLDTTLSDYKGYDPLIHRGHCGELVTCLVDLLTADAPMPPAAALRRGARDLRATAIEIKRELGIESVFRRAAFKRLVTAATKIGVHRGFIEFS